MPTRPARRLIALLTFALIVFGAVSALRVVGLDALRGGREARPLAFDDYSIQFYYAQLGAQFLARKGTTFGYDPDFMAGYPKTPLYYPSSKPFEFALWAFDSSDPARVFNRTVGLMLAVLPLLMFGAAVNFGLQAGERLAAVALATLPHAMVPMAGFYGIMEAAGMVAFIFASFLSLYVVSAVYRYFERGGRAVALSLFVAAPLLYLSHLTALVISAVPLAVLAFEAVRRRLWSRLAVMALVAGAVLAVNWRWIEGYLLYAHYADLGDFYTKEGATHFVPAGGLLAPFHVYVPSPAVVSLIPPVLGAVGAWLWVRERRWGLVGVFVPQIVCLFVLAFYGGALGLNALAPARITLPLGLYLFVPAAAALAAGVSWVWRRSGAITKDPRRRAIRIAALLAIGIAAQTSDLPERIWRPYTLPILEAREGYAEHGDRLIDWLRANVDARAGRLLHEETDRAHHQYFGTHMAALIPWATDIEMAGPPAPHALVRQNFLRFIAGTLRDRPIRKFDARELASYLDLYDVGYVLCWTNASKQRFAKLPFATPVGDYEKFTLYRIDRPHSRFLKGSGSVEVVDGELRLRDVVAEDGVVVLKYHWLESLESDPPGTLLQYQALDDPTPFIGIENPPSEFVIREDPAYGLFSRSTTDPSTPVPSVQPGQPPKAPATP